MGPMSMTFSCVVYVKPPHARQITPITTRTIPTVLFIRLLMKSEAGNANAASLKCLLLIEYFLDLTDLALDFAGEFLRLSFGL